MQHAVLTIASASTSALVLLAACWVEDRRDTAHLDERVVLAQHVERAVAEHGDDLDGAVYCTSSVSADSLVTARCEGTAATGSEVVGRFSGTSAVDAGTCRAGLLIRLGGSVLVDDEDVDCFSQP